MAVQVRRLNTVRSLAAGLTLALSCMFLTMPKADADGMAEPGGADAPALGPVNPGGLVSLGANGAREGADWDFTGNGGLTGGEYNIASLLIAGGREAAMPSDVLICIAAVDFYLYAVQDHHFVDTLLAVQNFAAPPAPRASVFVIPATFTSGIIEASKTYFTQNTQDLATPEDYDDWMAGKYRQPDPHIWFGADCGL